MRRLLFLVTSSSAGGVLLLIAAALGLVIANTPLYHIYEETLEMQLGPLPVHLWINDVLMSIFFLFVGLEVKREMINGELNTNAKRMLPGISALCGLLVPALIYYAINSGNAIDVRGWAIPTATDIAFAIAIVTALGRRVSLAMKSFLTALAVMDDLMAIVVIAIFYTSSIAWLYLVGAAVITGLLIYMNKSGYIRPIPYIVLGIGLWYCVFNSGLHATLAGVILAMTIPFSGIRQGRHVSPIMEWEHALNNWVALLIIPLFGLANTGVSFAAFDVDSLANPVVLGIVLGLFFGKQIGVFGSLFALVKAKVVPMPAQTSWLQVYGIALCCGIGFTMSLFISLLAFTPGMAGAPQELAKVGIFVGSILSGVLGYIVLRLAALKK
ncbi:MAG: Na+/H+ antiporter NhaA [Veillonellaceae bacterium]|nr:Na+/H+ antiporter NhaA [Veillonellaceae bacterium]